jgi:fatty-acyl-CoA synthase
VLVTEIIRAGADRHAEATAVLWEDKLLTYGEIDRLSNRLAHVLLDAAGVDRGDRVGLLMSNSQFTLPVDFACAKAGVARVPLNARLAAAEHAQMLASVKAQILIFSLDQASRAADLAGRMPTLQLFCLGAAPASADMLALAKAASDTDPGLTPRPDDVVLDLFTSGTTGKLKAAEHTQASWGAVSSNILGNLIDVQPGDAMMHAASLIHASGTFILPYWLRGGVAAILPGFVSSEYLKAIETWRPKALNLVPTMIGMLLEDPAIHTTDLSSVETIIYGASPMPRPTIKRAIDLLGPRFAQYYGQTEAPLCIAVLRKEDHVGPGAEARLSACGRVSSDCEVRLVDEAGADVGPGAPGEIAVRAPFGMTGYHDADAINAETLMPGGWIRTRDIGRFDEEGFLYLVDRTSDMIVTGGYNVYPREVEDILADHPAVREVVVVGLPDDKWGEAVTAFVAVRSGSSFDEPDLLAHARAHLAGYKVPKSVRVIDEIPKSAVGKILRRAVRDPFWAGRERSI